MGSATPVHCIVVLTAPKPLTSHHTVDGDCFPASWISATQSSAFSNSSITTLSGTVPLFCLAWNVAVSPGRHVIVTATLTAVLPSFQGITLVP